MPKWRIRGVAYSATPWSLHHDFLIALLFLHICYYINGGSANHNNIADLVIPHYQSLLTKSDTNFQSHVFAEHEASVKMKKVSFRFINHFQAGVPSILKRLLPLLPLLIKSQSFLTHVCSLFHLYIPPGINYLLWRPGKQGV